MGQLAVFSVGPLIAAHARRMKSKTYLIQALEAIWHHLLFLSRSHHPLPLTWPN